MSTVIAMPETDYTATLPRKRMAASVLFFDSSGRVLLAEPTYKDYWEIPGGAVEADESPHQAAVREIKEELGIVKPLPDALLAIDWVPPRPGRTEGLITVFDGGLLSEEAIANIQLPADELRSVAFCTLAEGQERLSELLALRLASCLSARDAGRVAYLEYGRPLG